MNKSTSPQYLGSNVLITHEESKKVILLDGRIIDIKMGSQVSIKDRDGNSTPLAFDGLDKRNGVHQCIFMCLATTLSTHSLRYNSATTYAILRWLSLPCMAGKTIIDIPEINCISEIAASYRPFITPLLRRVKCFNESVLTAEVIDFLENTHSWEEKSNGAYLSLITNDPEKGALTDQEIHNLSAALNKAYSEQRLNQENFTLCWFFIGTGVRPVQAKRMRRKDVIIHNRAAMEVTLRVPLAKGEMTVSEEYWARRAPTVLAECLIHYIDSTEGQNIEKDSYLFTDSSSREISGRLIQTFAELETYSDRTGGKISIIPYRFRYTLATRALAQGASDYEVARLLTHRSTSCIHYYRASMPELQKPVRDALGKEMGYFARAFQGKAISGLEEATRAGDPDAVITDFLRLMGKPVGACGTRADCHQNAPVACLAGCAHFEPLLSAPWETLMVSLVADQEMETEPRIRQINHNAMSAIQQIIALRDESAGTE